MSEAATLAYHPQLHTEPPMQRLSALSCVEGPKQVELGFERKIGMVFASDI